MRKTPFYKKLIMKVRGQIPTEDLIKKGLKVGEHFSRRNDVIIDGSHCYIIEIGDHVTMANGVHVLAHDASSKMYLGYTKIAPVHIGNYVFLGAKVLVLPGVCIGNRCIIGAGSVVTKNIPDNSVAVGNPARVISTVDAYINKNIKLMENSPMFNNYYTDNANLTGIVIAEIKGKIGDGFGFIV